MENNIYDFNNAIKQSSSIVFLGGAGVSTASGIPDFRGKNGLYITSTDENPEEKLSTEYFESNPEGFYDYYRKNFSIHDIQPNIIHEKLAKLEEKGKLKAIITQNIDGLHQKAGSKNVLELHGTDRECECTKCGKHFDTSAISLCETGVPVCDKCGGIIKPCLVLYGDALDIDILSDARNYVSNADMLIVAGTSLKVYPAAGLINYFDGKVLAILNNTMTPYDRRADIVLRSDLVDIFSAIKV